MTTLNDLQKSIEDQLAKSDWFNKGASIDLTHAILGITEEAGELAGLCKRTEFRHKERSNEDWLSEFGDVLWYLVAAIHLKGLSLETVWEFNCNKLAHRREVGKKGRDTWEG